MSIELKKDDKDRAVDSIRQFVEEELELEISGLQAGFVLDFFLKELAPLAYNKGIEDARDFFAMRAEDLVAACFEKPFQSREKKLPRGPQ